MPEDRRLVEGTDDVIFIPELSKAESDYVVIKRRVSAFTGTPLEIYLRGLNIKTLVVGGVFTDQGVETTVRDAFDRDFDIVVVGDACWSPSNRGHEHAIGHTFPRLGRVRTVAELAEQGGLRTAGTSS
jgi:nicotinamidase-related amidase